MKLEDLKIKQNFYFEENIKKIWENESDKYRLNCCVFEMGKGRFVVEYLDGRKKLFIESLYFFL